MSGDNQVYGSEPRRVSINDLPKDVITYIMSLLPIEDAVRTSVLSKDWEYMWTSVNSIQISDHITKKGSLVNFVDRILLHSQNIRSISLGCFSVRDPTIMKAWISSLSARTSIQSIKIASSDCGGFTLPRCLLDSTSLTDVCLSLSCTMKVPLKDYLCNLKSLCLVHIHFQNEHFSNSDRVILTFPVLKTLKLLSCKWGNVNSVEISSPSLITFHYTSTGVVANDFLIMIRAAKLTNFQIIGTVLVNNFDLNPKSIACASIFVSRWIHHHPFFVASGSHPRISIEQFSGLRYLRLNGQIKPYAQFMPRLPLPRLESLQELELHIFPNTKNGTLIELLHMAPNLKLLIIGPYSTTDLDSEDYNFDVVEPVPSCMLSHLVTITFCKVLGTTRDLHLVKFMLKKSLKLEKVIVSVYPETLIPKADIEELLLTYPKGSPCVSVVFIQEAHASAHSVIRSMELGV